MVDTTLDEMKLQKKEFDAVCLLSKAYNSMPPIVDDDYPRMRQYYESALREFVEALKQNRPYMFKEITQVKKKKIYLASSWKNKYHDNILQLLEDEGHDVFNYREKGKAFSWSQIGIEDVPMFPNKWRLDHTRAIEGFNRDLNGLNWCDVCILLLPSGNSAHIEMGYAVGQKKKTIILCLEEQKPDLMYKMVNLLTDNINEMLEFLNNA